MNRLSFLEQTFLQNIRDNTDYDQVEFVLLNYNSSDAMEEWVRDNLAGYIAEGRVVYIHEKTAKFFRPAHSRNVCVRMARGEVICNVDADNFTGAGFAQFLYKIFSQDELPRIANTYDLFEFKHLSTHGRIAIRKWHFLKMGGYDETFIGWGSEDGDLNRRCMSAGFIRSIIPPEYLRYIDHEDELRVSLIDFSELGNRRDILDLAKNMHLSNEANWKRSLQLAKDAYFSANFGRTWGKASVIRNFTEQIELDSTWVKWENENLSS